MNKNTILIAFALGGFLIGIWLLLSPVSSSLISKSHHSPSISKQPSNTNRSLHINIQNEDQNKNNTSSNDKQKKIDPTIKAAAIDHYNTYLIQIIDDNPEDKNITLQKDPKTYTYIRGKIEGKQFTLRLPKAILEKPGIQLKITNLQTKETKLFKADFLAEVASLPEGGNYYLNIDLTGAGNIQTETRLPPTGVSAFPTILKTNKSQSN